MAQRLLRQQADRLVSLPKHISEQIRWNRVQGGDERYECRAIVTGDTLEVPIILHGAVGKSNWSFVLMVEPDTPIRKLTVHAAGHTNPDGSDAGTHHKHIWDEVNKDRETYYPNDIDFSDINEALLGFLKESNITPSFPPERLIIERRLR